ncbi:MAG: YifB family Mg chelatase-like AAA ATPase [Planctomycetia bacterium]|nr:YifB family Mg chelatase-like AAA ATPase [Planctomycetia bacterium]
MLAGLRTFSLLGIDAVPVDVETDLAEGMIVSSSRPVVVGLPDATVRESVHRIHRAIDNSGYYFPDTPLVFNLAPADLPKEAAAFDLPMALGVLLASDQIQADPAFLRQIAMVGELALDGSTRPVRGVLPIAMSAVSQGIRTLMVPESVAEEAAVVDDLDVIAVSSLSQAVQYLTGAVTFDPVSPLLSSGTDSTSTYDVDYTDVRGQEMAKRALMVAAAGGHNVLMIGPPGSGKTMLAQRLPTILPELTPAESLETTRVYSVLGLLPGGVPRLTTRPFRSPHHTISDAGLIGGGSVPRPGEISLASHGVLFLDELPEFHRRTLEVLRQPLEERSVTISRASGTMRFPAEIMLVAAMNPCPCGFRGDSRRECHCNVPQIERYMGRLSGPLIDRIDIQIEVPAVAYRELQLGPSGLSSAEMRDQVAAARAVQRTRFDGTTTVCNARMSSRQLRKYCVLNDECDRILELAMTSLALSARAHDRVLRVARTIADLDGSPTIESSHLLEATQYRSLDRQLWT